MRFGRLRLRPRVLDEQVVGTPRRRDAVLREHLGEQRIRIVVHDTGKQSKRRTFT